jgi:hypothetical protein
MTTYLIALAIAFFGATFHWFKRYTRNQTNSSLIEYITAYKGYTMASIGSIMTTVGALLGSGHLDISNPSTISSLLLGGYFLDSGINKDIHDDTIENFEIEEYPMEQIQDIEEKTLKHENNSNINPHQVQRPVITDVVEKDSKRIGEDVD